MANIFVDQDTLDLEDNQPTTVRQSGEPRVDAVGIDRAVASLSFKDFEIYQNPLLSLCSDLIAMLVALPRLDHPSSIESFRQYLLDSIAEVRNKGLFLEYHPSIIEKACFVLCVAFDELILHTEWGKAYSWENNSLLSKVFKQRNGGEVFFELLNQAKRQPSRLIDFIELQLVILKLGFRGRYRFEEKHKINEIFSELNELIDNFKEPAKLYKAKRDDMLEKKGPSRFISKAMMVIVAVIAMGVALLAAEIWYHNRVAYTVAEFESLAKQDYTGYQQDQSLVYVDTANDIAVATNSGDEPVASGTASALEEQVKGWYVVLATFNDLKQADKLSSKLESEGHIAFRRSKNDHYQVVVYAGKSAVEAKEKMRKLDQHYGLRGDMRQMKIQSNVK